MSEDFIEVKTRIRRKRTLKTAYNQSPTDGTRIPAIRFSGGYLEDLGFVVGGQYELTVNQDNSITLRPKPEGTPEGEVDGEGEQ